MADSLPLSIPTDTYTLPYSSPSATSLPIYNPATGSTLTSLQPGDATTVAAAVAASKAALPRWKPLPPAARAQALHRCADALLPHLDDLATLLCLENGKPARDARDFDLNFAVGCFRYYASLVDKLPGQFYDRGGMLVQVVREAKGVCAAVLPFNWPPIHTAGKIAPALAMGNTLVLKPGDQAPLTSLKMVEILQGVLPKDVLLAVPGAGPEVPAALVGHRDVKMVSFTGSTAAGKKVAEAAGKNLTHVAHELGGKNAFVVFEDADVEGAVRNALEGAFFNKGEACTASSRCLVHESVYETFLERLVQGVRKLKVGDGMDPETHVGPAVSQEQRDRVMQYLQIGQEEGAAIAAQAEVPQTETLKHGYWVPPTVLANVKAHMRVATEEIFGPVVTVGTFRDEDEVVDIVNESAYGLTCVVYTKDMERSMRMSRRVEAGMVFLNNYRRNVLGTPFGGVKDTGGAREHCIETMSEWSHAKMIQLPSGVGAVPEWRAVEDVFGKRCT